jgi:polyisoprenoid-binding protein YceI
MSAVASKTVLPAGTWAVDPVHSTIGFQVTDTSEMFSTIVGRFTAYQGGIEGGDAPTLAGTIDVESVKTDNDQRDAHLRSPDFFDAENYPEIRFRSTAVEPTGEDTFRVRGELTIKDTPFEIELDGNVRGVGTGKAGDERLVVDASGAFDWGTTTVQITAAVSATKEA